MITYRTTATDTLVFRTSAPVKIVYAIDPALSFPHDPLVGGCPAIGYLARGVVYAEHASGDASAALSPAVVLGEMAAGVVTGVLPTSTTQAKVIC